MSFLSGFWKVAVDDLPEQARLLKTTDMQTAVPGTSLRNNASTGQGRQINVRSRGVANEDKYFSPALKHDALNARHGGGKKDVDI